ncbi:MAG: pyridoxamine 5'-phosphate oxidase family protein [Candidatus Kariarchaeaceae archaeon]
MESNEPMKLKKLSIPSPITPRSIDGYNLPKSTESLLNWKFVGDQMMEAKYYWIVTTNKSGVPHSVPIWGLWFENRIFFGGSPKTKWVNNIKTNPLISVHLQSAEQVCIIKGKAIILEDEDIDEDTWNILDKRYEHKYQQFHGSPYIYLEPTKVLAWNSEKLDTMTIWDFQSF